MWWKKKTPTTTDQRTPAPAQETDAEAAAAEAVRQQRLRDWLASRASYNQMEEIIEKGAGRGEYQKPEAVLTFIARQNKRMLDKLKALDNLDSVLKDDVLKELRGLRSDVNGLTGAVSFGFFVVVLFLGVLGVMIYLRFFPHLPV
jgi:hypothetical protein